MISNELIEKLQAADPLAQHKFFQQQWKNVYDKIFSATGDHYVADETSILIFEKVFKYIGNYDTSRSFEPWFKKIIYNTLIDYFRSKTTSISFDEISSDIINKISQENAPEQPFGVTKEEDKYELLELYIKKLNPQYKEIIIKRFFEEKSIKTIAEEMNISPGNVKVRILRAKTLLTSLVSDAPLNKEE